MWDARGKTEGVPLSLLTADGWSHVMLPAINLALGSSYVEEKSYQDYRTAGTP